MGRVTPHTGRGRRPGTARAWAARLFVVSSLVATAIFAGPRALAVARGRLQALTARGPAGPRVELDRVGFVQAPAWLRGELLRHVSTELAAVLRGEVGLHDAADADRLLAELRSLPWVRDADLQRVYPDRLRATLALRRPIASLEVASRGGGAGRCFLDADGVVLPATRDVSLPVVAAGEAAIPAAGQRHTDAAVRAAVAVAVEWAGQIAPRVRGLPDLLVIDTTNHGYARIGEGRWCEVRVGLRRAGGGVAWLDYDHAPGSSAPRVALETKIDLLNRLLALYPGLAGVDLADLRFARRWESWVKVTAASDEPGRARDR